MLDNYKYFNKKRTIKNIRFLFKQNPDIKVGFVEKNANVGAGYLSRLEKDGSNKDPSIEFLAAVSEIFHIRMDDILYSDLEEDSKNLSPNEKSIDSFISSLFDDTKVGDLLWNKFSQSNFDERIVRVDFMSTDEFPFLNHSGEGYSSNDNGYIDGYMMSFKSSFYEEMSVDFYDVIYETSLKRMSVKAYILPINYNGVNVGQKYENEFEIYVVDNNKLIPICSTLKLRNSIKKKISDLYDLIKEYNSNVTLSSDAKSFLDDYLYVPDLPFK